MLAEVASNLKLDLAIEEREEKREINFDGCASRPKEGIKCLGRHGSTVYLHCATEQCFRSASPTFPLSALPVYQIIWYRATHPPTPPHPTTALDFASDDVARGEIANDVVEKRVNDVCCAPRTTKSATFRPPASSLPCGKEVAPFAQRRIAINPSPRETGWMAKKGLTSRFLPRLLPAW